MDIPPIESQAARHELISQWKCPMAGEDFGKPPIYCWTA